VTTAYIPPDIVIEGDGSGATVPNPPVIVQLGQYGAIVVARVQPPPIYPNPIVAFTLFRSLDGGVNHPWENVDSEQCDPYSVTTDLVDPNPQFGTNYYYAATANDSYDNVSAYSSALSISAVGGQTN